VQFLIDALSDPATEVVATAVGELGGLAPASQPAADALYSILETSRPSRSRGPDEPRGNDRRHLAIAALARLRDARVLRAVDEELRRPAPDAWIGRWLEQLGVVAAPLCGAVLDLLPRLPTGNLLIQCTVWLGSLGPPAESAVPLLAAMLRQGRADLAAAAALVSLGPLAAPARAELAALLDAADPIQRVRGAMALWHIDGDVEPLLRVTDAILDGTRWAARVVLDHLAEVGPPAAPLLPRLAALLGDADEWQRVTAARAVWRISGDEDLVAPVLVAAAGPQPVGALALEMLAELSSAATAPLARKLQEWIESDRRLHGIGSVDDIVENDERLAALCRTLLARLNPAG
jgi:hypothetical protein